MRRVLFETAINRAALITNGDRRYEIIKQKINRRGDNQADEFSVIAENDAEGENENPQPRVEIFL